MKIYKYFEEWKRSKSQKFSHSIYENFVKWVFRMPMVLGEINPDIASEGYIDTMNE